MPETYSTEGPQCPHCGRQFTADDPSYYDEMRYKQDECDECGKPFSVSVYHSVSWTCEALPDEQKAQRTGATMAADGELASGGKS